MAIARSVFWVEGIDVLEMRRRGVQTLSVDDQVPVITELNAIPAHGHHALDVKLVLRKVVNSFGFEDDNLAPLGRTEVVRDPVHEQVISRINPEFHDVVALVEGLAVLQPGARLQGTGGRSAVVRREPNYVGFPASYQLLPDVKD